MPGKISFRKIKNASLLYISLPVLCFDIGFLKWYYAIVCVAALCACLYFSLHGITACSWTISRRSVLFVFFAALAWTYLGGMNGFWFQSSDWDCRNAIYFDLIRYSWPVLYEANSGALVYYIGFWLPPAVVAKAVILITKSSEIGLMAGRILLWIWSSIGITVTALLLFRVLNTDRKKQYLITFLIFVFFSGLDLVGGLLNFDLPLLLQPRITHVSGPHLEPWMWGYQFSSNTTLLFWVFNQTIVTWIVTLLFLENDKPSNYAFYCVPCLLCGPFPCIGLAVLMIVKAASFILKSIRKKEKVLKHILTPQNLLSLIVLFPPVALYLLSANAAADVEVPTGSAFASSSYFESDLYLFILLEVGLYLLMILIDHYKNPIYYFLWVTFIAFPAVHIGTSIDFCMRATIPALFVLMVYVIQFLLDHWKAPDNQNNKALLQKACARFLIVFLLIGTATPAVEFYRGFYHVYEQKTLFLENRRLMTFDREGTSYNFVTSNPEDHFFFKYLAK